MEIFTQPIGSRAATLTGYVQQTSTDLPNLNVCPAVLICPGGGYAYCSDREAEPVALAFLNAGFNAFVLRYTVSQTCPPEEVFGNALAEAEASLTYLRDHAEALHIDPDQIALLGFSAGAHLTAALGTMGRVRPRALLLGYGVFEGAIGAPLPDLLEKIDENTPPAFLFATQGDRLVPAVQSMKFATRLAEQKTPYELHIFSYGDHGASLGTPNVTAPNGYPNPDFSDWFAMAVRFLHHLFRNDELVPLPAEVTAYGIEMNLGKLLNDPVSAPVLLRYLPQLPDHAKEKPSCLTLSLKKFQLFGHILPKEQFAALAQELNALN